MKVLFLTAWYPHRYDAMPGLFVRKHAEAVARQNVNVSVIYLHADEHVHNFEIVNQTTNAVNEIYVYFPFCKNKFFTHLSKGINYVRAFKKAYRHLIKTVGQPDVCQANVLTRSAVLAWWLKCKYSIPYVVVEHWSRYLPQNFNYKGFFHRKITEFVARHASCVLTVSKHLQKAMETCGIMHNNYQKINNVVDDFFFESCPKLPREKKRILHVSCFDESAKNICGILRAVKQLSLQRSDFELVCVGTGKDFERAINYSNELELNNFVRFVGEQTPQEVCQWFYQSDFFVMFSNFENAPVVVSESMACGRPIVATKVGGIPEMFDKKCGIFVEPRDEQLLVEKLNWMLDHFGEYDEQIIRESAYHFSPDAVGKRLLDVYKVVLRD